MISYAKALEIIADAITPLTGTERALTELAGCAADREIISNLDVPAFANAAMDGFAVRAADTFGASEGEPLEMPVTGMIAAGDAPANGPANGPMIGAAVEIMTGAPVPENCDSIVPVEQVDVIRADSGEISAIRLREPARKGRHVRMAGEDFRIHDPVPAGGSLIEPHQVMGLAATGHDRIYARPAPRIAVITTGSELATGGHPPQAGCIRDANGPYLSAFIEFTGAELSRRDNVPDLAGPLETLIAENSDTADIVLTTGGVSAGRFDIVPDVVNVLGGEILFHKVSIRPGKPLLFARLQSGSLLFGLPGNPIAVAACMRFFVLPAIRILQGLPAERFHTARNLETFHKRGSLRFFGKASAAADADGRLEARLLPGQESFRISPLLQSNCWMIAPEGGETIEAGDLIQIASLYPTSFLQ